MRKCLSNTRACPRGRFGLTQRELPNKITPYICPAGGDLSAERSYLVLAFLTIFVSLVSIAAPVRAGEKGALSSPAVKEEKGSDLVLSPKDVEGEIGRNEEPEAVEELDSRFFTNTPDEVEKGDRGSDAGLMSRIDKFIR